MAKKKYRRTDRKLLNKSDAVFGGIDARDAFIDELNLEPGKLSARISNRSKIIDPAITGLASAWNTVKARIAFCLAEVV